MPPLRIQPCIVNMSILLKGLSRVKYCQIADMLLAPSDSHEINLFATTIKTVVAKGSTAQLPVLAFRASKNNVFPVSKVKQS